MRRDLGSDQVFDIPHYPSEDAGNPVDDHVPLPNRPRSIWVWWVVGVTILVVVVVLHLTGVLGSGSH